MGSKLKPFTYRQKTIDNYYMRRKFFNLLNKTNLRTNAHLQYGRWMDRDRLWPKAVKSHSKETTWPKRLQYSTQSFSLDEEKEDQDGGRQLKQNTCYASKYWASTDLIFNRGGYAASSLSHSKLAIQLVSAVWAGCSIWQQSCCGVTILVCNDIKKVISKDFLNLVNFPKIFLNLVKFQKIFQI